MDTDRLYTATFFTALAYNFLIALNFTNNAIYPLYVTHAGGGATAVGLFISAYSLAAVLGRPVIGPLIDRFGVRPVLIAGSLFIALPPLGYLTLLPEGLHPLVWLLRIIQGFGFGAHFTAFFTLAAEIAPRGRRNESVAMYGISGLAANLAGPAFGEWLVTGYGLEAFFLAMTSIGLGGAFLALFLRGRLQPAARSVALRSLFAVLKARALILPLFLALLLALSFATPIIFLAPLASQRGIPGFSLYFTGFALAGITIRLAGRKWGDRFGWRRILIPSFITYAVGLGWIYFSRDAATLVVAGLFTGSAHGLAFPAVTSLGYTLAPDQAKGSAMALVTGMMDLGVFATGAVFGFVAEARGYGAVFPLALLAPILAALTLVIHLLRVKGRLTVPGKS
jgi:MFS family permease